MASDLREKARRLRNAVEPVAAGVYFAPEAHAAYEALGFDGSPPPSSDGIARPGFARLQRRGLMTDAEQLTDAGRAFREEIEVRTDELERPIIDALGDDLDDLVEVLDAWSEAIIAAGSYPQRIAGVYDTGGGPHVGSGLTIDTAAQLHENEA
jgi:hypothetical protein